MAKLIGIGGKLRAGKNVVSDHLEAEHAWAVINMSDALNDALLAMDPWIEIHDAQTYVRYVTLVDSVGYVEAKTYPDVRRYLQLLGTEVGRNMIGDDVWVDIVRSRVKGLMEAGCNVIVTGIRFDNELKMIKQLGGESWWVDRPSLNTSGESAAHSSETGVTHDMFDTVLTNVGTVDDLERIVNMSVRYVNKSQMETW